MKTKIPLILALLLTITSCDQISDNYREQKERENYTSPYMGRWVGAYEGNESGTLIISVQKSGNISGNYGPNNDMVLGTVNDEGAIIPVASDKPMFLMYGSLIHKKGTWKNKDKQGSWTLTKQ